HVRGDLRGVNDVLAREAGDVRARPADVLAFDDRNSSAFRRQRPRQQFSGLAAAEHEEVILFDLGHLLLLRRVRRFAMQMRFRYISPGKLGGAGRHIGMVAARYSARRATTNRHSAATASACRGRGWLHNLFSGPELITTRDKTSRRQLQDVVTRRLAPVRAVGT